MIKLSKIVDSFEEIIQILKDAGYMDDILGDMSSVPQWNSDDFNVTIDDLKITVMDYTRDHMPGLSNYTFPNCINMNIGPYGFSYMKDGIGLGVSIRTSKKGDTKYIISFSFNKDASYLKHSSVYNYGMNNDFDVVELTSKKK